jgi:hypothetical protein
MPLDHYVSQVHLKNFYSPALDGHMFAIRKSDLKKFPCASQDVCRIEDGSTNAYLKEDRAIEDFLLDVEPKYNASVAKLRDDKIDQECIYAVAGFVAYVAACSPTAMRINTAPLQGTIAAEIAILDKQGLLEKAPPSLGGKSATELLAEGAIRSVVDPKFPQAISISNVTHFVSVFGNSRWEILHNNDEESPFFTSDYPVAIETTSDRRILNKIAPLTPNLAVRIMPNIAMSGADPDLSFAKFSHTRRTLKHHEVRNINRLLVQCAEDIIFHRDQRDWIEKFVAKNRHYRIDTVTSQIPQGTGFLVLSSQRVVSHNRSA